MKGGEIQHHRQQTGEHICHRLGNNHAIIAPNATQCPNDKTVDHALTADGQHEGAHRLAGGLESTGGHQGKGIKCGAQQQPPQHSNPQVVHAAVLHKQADQQRRSSKDNHS